MNYKLLFPTYRNRYRFVQDRLARYVPPSGKFDRGLSLGTGEGDYDPMIAAHCRELVACDINPEDVAFAKKLNRHVPNVTYQVENALSLSFPDDHFDLIVSVEVMEHVGQPEQMTRELARVLRPGGVAILTFPSLHFPFTYDPINRVLSWFGDSHIAQGAYAFGHEYLIDGSDFCGWAESSGLEVVESVGLSRYLVGLLEMYWTGMVQRLFKANAANLAEARERRIKLRPTTKEPALTILTDALLWLDRTLFAWGKASVGHGFVVRKPSR